MQTTISWVKDPKVEHNCRQQFQLKPEIESSIAVADINFELSADKQVRLGAKVDENRVLEYAQRMVDGAPFSMCLLNKLKKGYFIWSGIQRLHAVQLVEDTHIPAYVVSVTDPRLSDIMARVVNVWDRQREFPREEMLIHAAYMVQRHGVPTAEAAQLMGLKQEWLVVHLKQAEIAGKLESQGVSLNGFSKSLLKAMGPLSDNANVLRETAKFIHKHKLAGNRAMQVIEDVKRGETEAQRIVELEKWEKTMAPAKRKSTVKVPYTQRRRDRCLELLGRFDRFTDGVDSLTQLQIVESEDVTTVRTLWHRIASRMDKLMKEQ